MLNVFLEMVYSALLLFLPFIFFDVGKKKMNRKEKNAHLWFFASGVAFCVFLVVGVISIVNSKQ